jgi:hypothetical protein
MIDTNREEAKGAKNGFEMINRAEPSAGRARRRISRPGNGPDVVGYRARGVTVANKQGQQTNIKDRSIIHLHIPFLLMGDKPRRARRPSLTALVLGVDEEQIAPQAGAAASLL